MEKRQTFISRLDENVIVTMLSVSVVACIIFAFKVKNYEPCVPFTIRVSKGPYYTGQPIWFNTDASRVKKLHWSFSDKKGLQESSTTSTSHIYNQPGDYTITLMTDANCTQTIPLTIYPAPKVVNPLLVPEFIYPQMAEVGKPVTFQDTTKGATRWEWRFGETAAVDDTSVKPTYVYKTEGLKTVSLVVNNDPQRYMEHKIFVKAAPSLKPPPPKDKSVGGGGGGKSIIVITDRPKNDPLNDQLNPPAEPPPAQTLGVTVTEAQLVAELRQVANKLRTAESFSAYLCGNLNIQISVNGSETTFVNFCNQLSELKNANKIKRLKVQQVKNEKNCIISMYIDYKKKEGFLGL